MRKHGRLAEAMESRRVELRMTWRDVADAGGMTVEGLRGIRRGERHPTTLTKRRIEDALRWQAGSVEQILVGGEPTAATADEPAGYGEWEPWAREMWDVAKAHDWTDDEAWVAIESVRFQRELHRRRPSA